MADGGASTSAAGQPASHTQSILAVDRTREVVMTHEIRASFNRQFNRKVINQYEFDHQVGRGQHGEVYLARDMSKAGMEVAIKAVRRKNPRQDKLSKLRKRNLPGSPHLPLTDKLGSTEHKIRKEIAIMKKCCHPHVVRLLEVIDDKLNERIFMVMEYLGGGEIKWRTPSDDPVLRVDQTRRICRDVILGLEYLHHQGIIHRDIKPANLLWSADRRTVKITDFGVSHFSYAQRLAAAGAGTVPPDDPESILMDDSDLSKTAGTPMFLAPEIVSDVSDVTASGSSSTLHLSATPRRKPAITKAIDVWAFGVTLYGLLFGHLPFQADTEYEIFQVIRRQDWTVDPTMGVDQLPTGGRHQRPQPKGEETDGYLVVKLLERLLEKDSRKRITLDEVKKHPWILRDLDNPQQWLRETKHDGSASLEPTPDETSSAMSSVRFRWSSRLAHRVSEILRRPWSKEGSSRDSDDQYKNVGVQSAPHIHLARRRSTTGASHAHSREGDRDRHPRDKGRQRSAHRDNAARNKSTTDVSRSSKEKDFPVWAMWNSGSAAAASSSVQIQGSAPKPRRGSFPSKTPPMMLEVPGRSSRVGSPQPSPMSYSQASTPSVESPEERPRSRLSLSSFAQWKLPWKKTTPQESQTPSVSRKGSTAQSRHRLARRSEDAFNAVKPSRQSTASGSLTLAMRAASWGEVADYGRPSEDMTSLYSAERDDALDDDTLLLGAGGVAQSPVTSLPSGLLSTVSSLNSLNSTASPPVISVAQTLLHRGEVGETATAADPAAQDAAALARQSQQRSRTTSPLAQMTYNHGEISINQVVPPYADDYDDASSFFDRDSQSSVLDFGDVELQPSTSQRYQDEDEESDDDDQVRLEVRPRRPSQSASPTERSPPRRSESSHRERVMICI